jgi:hypothetical protein
MIPGRARAAKLIRQGVTALADHYVLMTRRSSMTRRLARLIQIRRFKTVSLRYEPR